MPTGGSSTNLILKFYNMRMPYLDKLALFSAVEHIENRNPELRAEDRFEAQV